jgi:hypothetical protein
MSLLPCRTGYCGGGDVQPERNCTAKTHRGGHATMFVVEIALIVLGLILLVWAMGQAAR